MGTLLVGGPPTHLSDEQVEHLKAAALPLEVVITDDPAEMRLHADDTVVAMRNVPLAVLEEAPHLRWYQHWYAGVEHIVASDTLRRREVMVTNGSGVHAQSMAEQVFAMLLSFARGMNRSLRNQVRHEWATTESHRVWELRGSTMLVVGLGAIGTRIAEIARGFEMTVIGVKRRPVESGFRVVRLEELHEVLPAADIVVNVLPLTQATRHLFDAKAFGAMKSGAIFVNVGRGGHVDHDALIRALEDGHLGGAGLDVTDPEPLPSDSPLWDMENVMLTPHMAGITPEYGARIWPIALENLRRFHAGERLHNLVDFQAGY